MKKIFLAVVCAAMLLMSAVSAGAASQLEFPPFDKGYSIADFDYIYNFKADLSKDSKNSWKAVPGGFGVGLNAVSDRTAKDKHYVTQVFDDSLNGLDVITMPMNMKNLYSTSNTDTIISFKVKEDCNIYVGIKSDKVPTQWLKSQNGWTDMGNLYEFNDGSTSNYTAKVFKKAFKKDATVELGRPYSEWYPYMILFERCGIPQLSDTEFDAVKNEMRTERLVAFGGEELVFTKLTEPSYGIAVLSEDGLLKYTPSKDYVGQDSFRVRVSNKAGKTTEKTITANVKAKNYLVDELENSSKYLWPSNFLKIIKGTAAEPYDYDAVLEMNPTNSDQKRAVFFYRTDYDINTIQLNAYIHRSATSAEINVYVSSDNSTYQKVSMESRNGPKMTYQSYKHYVYKSTSAIPSGMRYVKIEMKCSSTYCPLAVGNVIINQPLDTEFEGYTPEDIKAMVAAHAPEHPRIKADGYDFSRMRAFDSSDSYINNVKTSIINKANNLLDTSKKPVIKRELDSDGYLLTVSREMLDRMEALGLAYQFTKDTKYVERAWLDLQAAASFSDWKMDHYLDTAEMTCAFGYAYDWMYDAWSTERLSVIRDAIVNFGLKTACDAYDGKAAWYTLDSNMNTVNNSGVMVGALAVMGEENGTDYAGRVIIGGLNSIQYSKTQYAPDGAFREGPNYWAYNTKYFINLVTSLEKSIGHSFGLDTSDGVSKTGVFPLYVQGPTGTFNYADGAANKLTANDILWFAQKFDRPLLAKAFKTENRSPSLFHYDKAYMNNALKIEENLPLDEIFGGAELAFFREKWNDSNSLYVGFKAGTPQESHGDMDMGTFVLDALGVRWAEDLGSENYNAGGIWNWSGIPEGKRYDYYRKNPEGHNTLLINPDSTQHQDALAVSKIVESKLGGEDGGYAIADLSPAYNKKANAVKRGVKMFDGRGRVLIQDEIKTKGASEVYWFMHTKTNITLQNSNKTAMLEKDGKKLAVTIQSPKNAVFEVMDAKALAGSRKPEGTDADNSGVKKLAIHLTDVENPTIVVVMTPLESGETEGALPEIVPLDFWNDPENRFKIVTFADNAPITNIPYVSDVKAASGGVTSNWRAEKLVIDGRTIADREPSTITKSHRIVTADESLIGMDYITMPKNMDKVSSDTLVKFTVSKNTVVRLVIRSDNVPSWIKVAGNGWVQENKEFTVQDNTENNDGSLPTKKMNVYAKSFESGSTVELGVSGSYQPYMILFEPEPDIWITNVAISEKTNSGFKVSADIINNIDAVSGIAIAALYDKDERLVQVVKSENITVSDSKDINLEFKDLPTLSADATVRLMFWKSITNITPHCDFVELDV